MGGITWLDAYIWTTSVSFVQLWLIRGEWRYPRMTTLPPNLVFYQVYVLVQVICFYQRSEQDTSNNSRMMASDSCCALDARAQHYPSSIGWGHFHLPTAFSLCILPLSRGWVSFARCKGRGVCTSFNPKFRHHTTVC